MAERSSATWSSRLGFILAAIGAAVGLGNIWKFPYVVGVSGGGAFVLAYVFAAAIVAIPVLVAELLIGRRGHCSPPFAIRALATEAGASRHWSLVAWLGLIAGYLILSYYSVVAGWTMAYVKVAASGVLAGLDSQAIEALFDELLQSPARLIFWHTIFIVVTTAIVAGGLKGGIERAVKVLMPVLFGTLLVMIVYSFITGDPGRAIAFLFQPDFARFDGSVVLSAVGHAFFSIGVSMGLMMAYGAYIPREISLPRSAVVIAAVDTAIALLAGLAIFPIVFANGLDPAEGPGLIFVTLPVAFGQMPWGRLFGTIFFLLLVVAAITSGIAVLEAVVAWAIDRFRLRRPTAAVALGALTWLIGLASVFSFNIWSEIRPLGMIDQFAESTIYHLIDYATANVMMPMGGLLIAVFAGWKMSRVATLDELGMASALAYQGWRFLIRFVVPVAILAIFLAGLG